MNYLKTSIYAFFALLIIAVPQAAMAQAQAETCTSFPCSYEANVEDILTIDGTVQNSSAIPYAVIDTNITIEQMTGTLYMELRLNANGEDVDIYGEVSRLGYNTYGMETLGPLHFTAVLYGMGVNDALPEITINDATKVTAFLTGLNIEDYESAAGVSGSSNQSYSAGDGDGGGEGDDLNGCDPPGTFWECTQVENEQRGESLRCNGPPIYTGNGGNWIPLAPIGLLIDWIAGNPNTPEAEECCAAHDLCFINGGCGDAEDDCDKAFGQCLHEAMMNSTGGFDPAASGIAAAFRIDGVGSGAFNLNPTGCRCVLDIPEDVSELGTCDPRAVVTTGPPDVPPPDDAEPEPPEPEVDKPKGPTTGGGPDFWLGWGTNPNYEPPDPPDDPDPPGPPEKKDEPKVDPGDPPEPPKCLPPYTHMLIRHGDCECETIDQCGGSCGATLINSDSGEGDIPAGATVTVVGEISGSCQNFGDAPADAGDGAEGGAGE